MSETKKEGLLQKIWNRTEDVLDAIQASKAKKNLQLSAERHVMEAVDALDTAEVNYEQSILEARNTKDFTKIVNAKLVLLTATKKKEEAVAVYRDLFEVDPKFLD